MYFTTGFHLNYGKLREKWYSLKSNLRPTCTYLVGAFDPKYYIIRRLNWIFCPTLIQFFCLVESDLSGVYYGTVVAMATE